MAKDGVSLFLAGDAMITRPWSHIADPRFLDLMAEIRAADVAIVNLETVIHDFRHPAQAQSGGTWTASPPSIAAELKFAGIDMLAHANNHTTDYGPGAVLETLRHAKEAGLILSGSGTDLQSARAPAYLQRKGLTFAHVSMASTFVPYGRASKSRADLAGRPGVNPLALRNGTVLVTPPGFDRILRTMDWLRARLTGRPGTGMPNRRFGLRCTPGARLRLERGRRPVDADAEANLAAIREAAGRADLTVVSVHAHQQGPWLGRFARRAIAGGADVILAHGPHEVLGIELHQGRPIFYGLGDFVYEPQGIARFPQEAYDKFGLTEDATADDVHAKIRQSPLSNNRAAFEGAAAVLRYEAGRLSRIDLLPIDLQFDAEAENRGRPQLADPSLGRRIIARIAAR